MDDMIVDLAVVGAGPAGMNAAIFGVCSGLSVVVLEKNLQEKVQADFSELPKGIDKDTAIQEQSVTKRLFQHMQKLGVEVLVREVKGLEPDYRRPEGEVWQLITDQGEIYAKNIVYATGSESAEVLKVYVTLDEANQALADADGYTGIPGLYVAGDIRSQSSGSIILAAAEGALAVKKILAGTK